MGEQQGILAPWSQARLSTVSKPTMYQLCSVAGRDGVGFGDTPGLECWIKVSSSDKWEYLPVSWGFYEN